MRLANTTVLAATAIPKISQKSIPKHLNYLLRVAFRHQADFKGNKDLGQTWFDIDYIPRPSPCVICTTHENETVLSNDDEKYLFYKIDDDGNFLLTEPTVSQSAVLRYSYKRSYNSAVNLSPKLTAMIYLLADNNSTLD